MPPPKRPASYFQREPFLVERCKGKSVLHLGCIGYTEGDPESRAAFFKSRSSLHSDLVGVARQVVGVDIDRETLELLRAQGSRNLFDGDVENLERSDVPRSPGFDVILAGDLLEHLSNPGLMLESVKSFLAPGGRLLVTTPNAYGLPNFLRFLRGKLVEGKDHVQSYSVFTLSNLLARHGWRVTDAHTCFQGRARNIHGRFSFGVGRRAFERYPSLGGTLIAVCEIDGGSTT
jgi:SAM-dependent methyltransferase